MVEDQKFQNYPAGLYDAMMFVKKRYNNPEVYIAENGLGLDDTNKEEMVNDDVRVKSPIDGGTLVLPSGTYKIEKNKELIAHW